MTNSDMPAAPYNYPVKNEPGGSDVTIYTGLTKREHFAGLAMQGFIANSKTLTDMLLHESKPEETVAEGALMFADALLKELDK